MTGPVRDEGQKKLSRSERVRQRIVRLVAWQAVPGAQGVQSQFTIFGLGVRSLMMASMGQGQGVDEAGDERSIPQPTAGRIQKAQIQRGVVQDEHPAGEYVEHVFQNVVQRGTLRKVRIHETVQCGALAHGSVNLDELVVGSVQADAPSTDDDIAQ